MPQVDGVAHVALTITDLDRSKEWYADVLGWQSIFDGEEEGLRYSLGILPGTNLIVGLRQHLGGTGERFTPDRTGLDHLAFGVPARADLEEWVETFKEKGVKYTDIIDAP